jgi:hypothetical protein
MRRQTRGRRWGAAGAALAVVGVIASAGLGWAADGSAGPAAGPTVHHLGPTQLAGGQQLVVSVTNLGTGAGRPTIAILGRRGAVLKRGRPSIAPDATALLSLLSGADGGVWRVRISYPAGSGADWIDAIQVLDGTGGPLAYRAGGGTSAPDDGASLAIVHVDSAHGLRVHVANVGSTAVTADIDLRDRSGGVVASGTTSSIAPHATESISFNFCCSDQVRAVVSAPSSAQIVASAEYFVVASGRTVALMEEEGIFYY